MNDITTAFFFRMEGRFRQLLARDDASDTMARDMVEQAFEWFERNVEIQAEGLPVLACAKGCVTCCSLRVTATAPEIFLLAQYIRLIEATPRGAAVDLSQRIIHANERTAGIDEAERFSSREPCPLLIGGICLVHPVRTLACRGHAAFDVEMCRAAANGEDVDVTISEPHLAMRGLVQHALQYALRDAGLPWGLYELNHALAKALTDPEREARWLAGEDSLAPVVAELDMAALGQAFDRLRPSVKPEASVLAKPRRR